MSSHSNTFSDFMSDTKSVLSRVANKPQDRIKHLQDFSPLRALCLTTDFWNIYKDFMVICGAFASEYKDYVIESDFLQLFIRDEFVYRALWGSAKDVYEENRRDLVYDRFLRRLTNPKNIADRYFEANPEYPGRGLDCSTIKHPSFIFDNAHIILYPIPHKYPVPALEYGLSICQFFQVQLVSSVICHSDEINDLVYLQVTAKDKLRTALPPKPEYGPHLAFPWSHLETKNTTANSFSPPRLEDIAFVRVHQLREIARNLEEIESGFNSQFPAAQHYQTRDLWCLSPSPASTPSTTPRWSSSASQTSSSTSTPSL